MEGIKLLLWKNFKIMSRDKLSLAISITFPLTYISAFAALRCSIEPIKHPDSTVYEAFSVQDIPNVVQHVTNMVYYAPSTPLTDSIMQLVLDSSFTSRGLDYDFIGFEREKELTDAYKAQANDLLDGRVLAGVIFTKMGFKRLPQNIQYTLKFPASQRTVYSLVRDQLIARPNWFIDDNWPYVGFGRPRSRNSTHGGFPGYFEEGYLYLQHAINNAIATKLLNKTQMSEMGQYDLRLQRFPAPPSTDDRFPFVIQMFVSFAFCVLFTYSVLDITRQIIREKSTGLKEYMKIMGLPSWQHWLGWFIQSYVFLLLIVATLVFILKLELEDDTAILTHSDPLVVFFALAVHVLNVVAFSFLLSTLFANGFLHWPCGNCEKYFGAAAWTVIIYYLYFSETSGSTAAAFLWVMSSFHSYGYLFEYFSMTLWEKILGCLSSPNSPITLIISFLNFYESAGEGLQWHNLWHGLTQTDEFSVGICIVMSTLNSLIYTLVALYIELAFPGQFGVALPWYFPFTMWFWLGKSQSVEVKLPKRKNANSNAFESDPKHLEEGVVIKNLTKVFGSKVAVNISDFKMYQNQVTSLLGPNGAGKTTTMSMLTGLIRPTEGRAWVNSFDITTEIVDVRASLGFCPQYNILFDDLTVEEHFTFYCKLKRLNEAETLAETDRGVSILGLEDKRKTLSKHLSGGMKRKLSVGMSLSAGSKVVILDEPTAGMDPEARRSTWDLIQAEKKGRTVILSTHYMEEADLLGDRIAIMADGELLCCGSSVFLKSKFGDAYNLTIVKSERACLEDIKRMILEVIPTVEFNSSTGTEISCTLPIHEMESFPHIFEAMESQKEDLGIITYGVGSTTMEEIFVRVTKSSGMENGKAIVPFQSSRTHPSSGRITYDSSVSMTQLHREDKEPNEGFTLLLQQFHALVSKKLLLAVRRKSTLLLQVVIPVIGITIIYKVATFFPGLQDRGQQFNTLEKMREIMGESTALFSCLPDSQPCQAFKTTLQDFQNVQKVEDTKVVDALLEIVTMNTRVLLILTGSHRRHEGKYLLAYEEELNSAANRTHLTVLFNNQPFHTPPVALNLLYNGLLRFHGANNTVTSVNSPFDYTAADDLKSTSMANVCVGIAISVTAVFPFLTGSSLLVSLSEKFSKFKHLQVIAGAKLPVYWLADFAVNIVPIVIAYLGLIIATIIHDLDPFHSWEVRLAIFICMLAYGWATIICCMFLSTVFSNATMTYSRVLAIGILGDIVLFADIFLQSPEMGIQKALNTLDDIFLYEPSYCLANAVYFLGKHHQLRQHCSGFDLIRLCSNNPENQCCSAGKGYYDWDEPGIGKHLVRLGGMGAISLVLLVVMETGLMSKISRFLSGRSQHETKTVDDNLELMDADVVKESRRINNSTLATLNLSDNLIMKDLTKVYKGTFTAVDGLNFGVKKGEVFGLLGINGAGKTSTFKMLTGDERITSGDAYVNYCSVKRDLHRARTYLGYCPQFDACIEELTGRETLTLFARLKGVPEDNIEDLVKRTSEALLFQGFLDKQYGSLSGGNKRKLSTAVAMLGDPSLILLDEPTAGMDPVARRHVWNAISLVRNTGKSVLLTSHNMEECETLCSTLAIMVKGKLKCLGSPQHLKSKLCPGYRLVVQLPVEIFSSSTEGIKGSIPEDWATTFQRFQGFLHQKLPGCILCDTHCGFLEHFLPKESTTWAKIFSTMEEAKKTFELEGYSVGQQDLEQVFFNFASE